MSFSMVILSNNLYSFFICYANCTHILNRCIGIGLLEPILIRRITMKEIMIDFEWEDVNGLCCPIWLQRVGTRW